MLPRADVGKAKQKSGGDKLRAKKALPKVFLFAAGSPQHIIGAFLVSRIVEMEGGVGSWRSSLVLPC